MRDKMRDKIREKMMEMRWKNARHSVGDTTREEMREMRETEKADLVDACLLRLDAGLDPRHDGGELLALEEALHDRELCHTDTIDVSCVG